MLFKTMGTVPVFNDRLKRKDKQSNNTGEPAFRILTPIPSNPIALPFARDEMTFITILGVISLKEKVLLFTTGIFMSLVLEVNFVANVEPMVAKKELKVLAVVIKQVNIRQNIILR